MSARCILGVEGEGSEQKVDGVFFLGIFFMAMKNRYVCFNGPKVELTRVRLPSRELNNLVEEQVEGFFFAFQRKLRGGSLKLANLLSQFFYRHRLGVPIWITVDGDKIEENVILSSVICLEGDLRGDQNKQQ